MYIFLQDLPTMNILDPIFFIARCSTIFASELPEIGTHQSCMCPQKTVYLNGGKNQTEGTPRNQPSIRARRSWPFCTWGPWSTVEFRGSSGPSWQPRSWCWESCMALRTRPISTALSLLHHQTGCFACLPSHLSEHPPRINETENENGA